MIQRHTIVLWKKADLEEMDFELIASEAYNVLNALNEFEIKYRPNFLTASFKEKIAIFDWNYENFSQKLKEGLNKDNGNCFEKLGYTISFFSSKEEKESFSYQLTVGNRDTRFYNTLIVSIPISIDLYDAKCATKIIEMFEKMVACFKPFWGCISNKAISKKYKKFMEGDLPTTVHWVNYWSDNIINKIGREKIEKIINETPRISLKNGIFKIKDTALNAENEIDINFLKKIEYQLALKNNYNQDF